MTITRRTAILSTFASAVAAFPVLSCAEATEPPAGTTRVYVLGTVHSNHLQSARYSLNVLEVAIRRAKPDVILTEIPPDRIDQALESFKKTGAVDEPRTQVFPEYTDVIFPLSRELDFEIVGTAGWTQSIADNRRDALIRIQNDPARSDQWAQHRAAQRAYAREIAGRGDDPQFIHTAEFDTIVEASRRPYQEFFDDDLGPGGWTQINRAHTDLIGSALDAMSGEGKTAVITFGTAHKYKILRALNRRSDVLVKDARALF